MGQYWSASLVLWLNSTLTNSFFLNHGTPSCKGRHYKYYICKESDVPSIPLRFTRKAHNKKLLGCCFGSALTHSSFFSGHLSLAAYPRQERLLSHMYPCTRVQRATCIPDALLRVCTCQPPRVRGYHTRRGFSGLCCRLI